MDGDEELCQNHLNGVKDRSSFQRGISCTVDDRVTSFEIYNEGINEGDNPMMNHRIKYVHLTGTAAIPITEQIFWQIVNVLKFKQLQLPLFCLIFVHDICTCNERRNVR